MSDYETEVLVADARVKEARYRLEGAEKLLAEAVLLRDNHRARALRALAEIADRRGTLRRYIPGVSVVVSELVFDSPYAEIALPPEGPGRWFTPGSAPLERFTFDAHQWSGGDTGSWKNGGAQWEYRL